jgi:hypothetical protein
MENKNINSREEFYRKHPQMRIQEMWRQKQIEIYYIKGRPLYKIKK